MTMNRDHFQLPPSLLDASDARAVAVLTTYYQPLSGAGGYTGGQFDTFDPNGGTAIRMSSGVATDSVIAVAGYDHDLGTPYEGMEFIIWGSNDGKTWSQGVISAIYRNGFDASLLGNGPYDDYTSQWSFGQAYTQFAITGGNHLAGIGQDTEGEIDALYAAAVPEPETYALFAAGLGLLGFVGRRRKAKR